MKKQPHIPEHDGFEQDFSPRVQSYVMHEDLRSWITYFSKKFLEQTQEERIPPTPSCLQKCHTDTQCVHFTGYIFTHAWTLLELKTSEISKRQDARQRRVKQRQLATPAAAQVLFPVWCSLSRHQDRIFFCIVAHVAETPENCQQQKTKSSWHLLDDVIGVNKSEKLRREGQSVRDERRKLSVVRFCLEHLQRLTNFSAYWQDGSEEVYQRKKEEKKQRKETFAASLFTNVLIKSISHTEVFCTPLLQQIFESTFQISVRKGLLLPTESIIHSTWIYSFDMVDLTGVSPLIYFNPSWRYRHRSKFGIAFFSEAVSLISPRTIFYSFSVNFKWNSVLTHHWYSLHPWTEGVNVLVLRREMRMMRRMRGHAYQPPG